MPRHLRPGRHRAGLSAADPQAAKRDPKGTQGAPGDVLMAGSGVELMVFAANRRITERARGISEATLRRHLAALVEGGWVIRRDSPNGKRYPRREYRGGPILGGPVANPNGPSFTGR